MRKHEAVLSWILCIIMLVMTAIPAGQVTAAAAEELEKQAEEQVLAEAAEEEDGESNPGEEKSVNPEAQSVPEAEEAPKPSGEEEAAKETPKASHEDSPKEPLPEETKQQEQEKTGEEKKEEQAEPTAESPKEPEQEELKTPTDEGRNEQELPGETDSDGLDTQEEARSDQTAGETRIEEPTGEEKKEEPAVPTETGEKKQPDEEEQEAVPQEGNQKPDHPESAVNPEETDNQENSANPEPESVPAFRPGYARVPTDEPLYRDSSRNVRFGTLSEEAVGYAVELDEGQGSLSAVFSVEGEPVTLWVSEENVRFLTESEQAAQEKEGTDLVWQERIYLKNVVLLPEEILPQEADASGESEKPEEENGSDMGEIPQDVEESSAEGSEDPEMQAKTVLSAPQNLNAVGTGIGITVSWTPEEERIYELQRRKDDGKWTLIDTGNNSVQTEAGKSVYRDQNAKPGHVYQYRLRLWDSMKQNRSAWITFGVFYTNEPTLKVSVIKASGYPKLTWSKSKGAEGYDIERITTNRATGKTSGPKKIKRFSGNDKRVCTDKKVAINRKYEYKILPFRKVGGKVFYSSGSAVASVNVRPIAGAPQKLKAAQTSKGVKLTWSKVKGSASYVVYYTNNPYAENPKWKKAGTTKKTSFLIKDKVTAKNSGVYRQYRVYTTAKLGGKLKKGPFAKTEVVYRLGSPTIKVTKGDREDTIIVNRDKVRGADRYDIYYCREGDSNYQVASVDGSQTSFMLSGDAVTGTQKHTIYVRAVSRPDKNRTGKLHQGPASAKKSITPTWTYVVIVGNDDYWGTEDDLPGIKFDVSGMKNVYKRRGATRITAGRNKTAAEIKSMITEGFRGAGKNSICVFVYAGHGYDDSGDLACLGQTSLSAAELKVHLDRNVQSEHVVFIHQACSSGGVIGKGTPDGCGSTGD